MAMPIAHKGITAGAKAKALTLLDLLVKPAIIKDAWAYFNDVQTKDTKYPTPDFGHGQARHHPQPGHHGPVPTADAEVLLRPGQV